MSSGRPACEEAVGFGPMEGEPTKDDIDALVGPATPHFAYQLRARVRELIEGLPEDHPVRRYGEEQMELLIASATRRRKRRICRRCRASEARAGIRSPAQRPPQAIRFPRADERRVRPRDGRLARIGKVIALRFAGLGAARVAIGYLRNDRAAEETAEELRSAGGEPATRGNVSSARVLGEVAESGPWDAVIHNAATGVVRPALETEDRHWGWTLNANAKAFLSLARTAAPMMPKGSSIVAISSLGSFRVLENYVLVGTSKAALESLVRCTGRRAGAARHPRQRRVGRGRGDRGTRPLPQPRADDRHDRARRPGGWSSRWTSPTPSRSSVRPTPR